jgi:hypothetical protein
LTDSWKTLLISVAAHLFLKPYEDILDSVSYWEVPSFLWLQGRSRAEIEEKPGARSERAAEWAGLEGKGYISDCPAAVDF